MKVVDEFDREIEGLGEQLVDRASLKPDLVVCLNPLENYVLLHECGLNNIPTVGVIDTDANPSWVTYPIPANDDRYGLLSGSCYSMTGNADDGEQSAMCTGHCWGVGQGRRRRAEEEARGCQEGACHLHTSDGLVPCKLHWDRSLRRISPVLYRAAHGNNYTKRRSQSFNFTFLYRNCWKERAEPYTSL